MPSACTITDINDLRGSLPDACISPHSGAPLSGVPFDVCRPGLYFSYTSLVGCVLLRTWNLLPWCAVYVCALCTFSSPLRATRCTMDTKIVDLRCSFISWQFRTPLPFCAVARPDAIVAGNATGKFFLASGLRQGLNVTQGGITSNPVTSSQRVVRVASDFFWLPKVNTNTNTNKSIPSGGLTLIVGTEKWGFSCKVQRRPPAEIFLNESSPPKTPL